MKQTVPFPRIAHRSKAHFVAAAASLVVLLGGLFSPPAQALDYRKPPIVAVHGAWHTGATMGPMTNELHPHGYAVHRVNLQRGKGRGLRDYVGQVAQACRGAREQSGLAPVAVGHSMGGGLLLRLMREEPELLGGAVLLAPADGMLLSAPHLFLHHPVAWFRTLMLMQGDVVTRNPRVARKMLLNSSKAVDLPSLVIESPAALWSLSFPTSEPERHPPVHVIGSPFDRIVPESALIKLAAKWGGTYDRIGGPHDLMLTHPREVAQAVRDAIERWALQPN